MSLGKTKHCFPNVRNLDKWIGVAFRAGSVYNPFETCVMVGTMGKFVHCELILGEGQTADVYSAYNTSGMNTGFSRSVDVYDKEHWHILTFPLQEIKHAQTVALQLLGMHIPYNSKDLWQCCVQAMLPFESEIDCDLPEDWKKGLFCSQMCLLFLRHLARRGDIQTDLVFKHHLESLHSRGCSPNTLYNLLSTKFKPLCPVES